MLTTRNKLTALQKVERANISLMSNPHTIAYTGVLMMGTYKTDKDFPTAYTDGVNCVYGEAFVDGLTEPQLRAVVMHETLHKTFQHLIIWQGIFKENAQVANMALDYVVNLIIYDICQADPQFIQFWVDPPPLLDKKYAGWDSGQVYKDLMRGGDNGQGAMDNHGWEDAGALDPEEAEAIAREVDQAIRQGQLLAKKLTGNQSRVLGELITPEENWRDQMVEFMMNFTAGEGTGTWNRLNRRWLQHDVCMPAQQSENMGSLLIGVDTSGSIDQKALTLALSHIQVICQNTKPERVDLLYWDEKVQAHEVYFQDDLDQLVKSTSPRGGGSTNASCVPEYIKENKLNPMCVVNFTDGYVGGDWGEWYTPVLWAIVGNKSVIAPVGKTVHI